MATYSILEPPKSAVFEAAHFALQELIDPLRLLHACFGEPQRVSLPSAQPFGENMGILGYVGNQCMLQSRNEQGEYLRKLQQTVDRFMRAIVSFSQAEHRDWPTKGIEGEAIVWNVKRGHGKDCLKGVTIEQMQESIASIKTITAVLITLCGDFDEKNRSVTLDLLYTRLCQMLRRPAPV